MTGNHLYGSKVSLQLTKLIAKQLGSNFKMKQTRGCRKITNAIPKEKNTLGLVTYSKFGIKSILVLDLDDIMFILKVYFGHADMGSQIPMMTANIAKLFDYVIIGSEDYYFLGQLPKPLPQFKNIVYPLDATTWLLSCTSLVCATFLSILIYGAHKVGSICINCVNKIFFFISYCH